jgi:type IV secretory pathway VirD2 relaxase
MLFPIQPKPHWTPQSARCASKLRLPPYTLSRDTTLDWVAANHYNTEHPHSHVIVRGQDLDGLEVGLKRDYICRGIPYRARDLATEQMDRQRALDRDLEQEHVLHDPRYWKDLDAYERTLQPQQKQDYEQELDRG